MARKDLDTKRIISTGQPEIDKKMGGGIPTGSLTLIAGDSDAGKSVLTQQLIWGCLRNGFKVTVLTTENTLRSLIKQMDSLSLDVLDYFLLSRLRIQSIQRRTAEEGSLTVGQLLEVFKQHEDRDMIVIDSLTPFFSHISVDDMIVFFEHCKDYCDAGMSFLTVVHSYAFDEPTLTRISSMCDAHLRLRIESIGNQLMRTLEVAKVRGAQQTTGNIISFEIEPKIGMRIIPFTRARA